MSKIQIVQGTFDETCTVQSNLTENQAKFPAIRDVIAYTETRMLSTMIVAGATDKSVAKLKPKIGTIPSDKLIGDNAYRYPVQGRIQKSSTIVNQVGSSGSDGSFTLTMSDNYLVPGMVAIFNGNNLQARVMSQPTGGPGGYVYNFQTNDGTVFSWTTHVSGQAGTKTCFGSWTSYSERSLRGYGRSHYPDMFINHLGIQRKTIAISGSAATNVLWVHYNGTKGWFFEKERQAKLQFLIEDEVKKWFEKSTMKDSSGNLLTRSRQIDPETQEEIVCGDGIIPQIEGGNEAYGSSATGDATIDDIKDMMSTLSKKSNSVMGKKWYIVTGTDGHDTLQSLFEAKASNTFNITMNKEGSAVIGGPEVEVGYNFTTYNVNGDQVVICKHPLFDDEERFTERGSDGKLLMSSKMIFLDMGADEGGKSNIEILGKGAYGINRTMVSAYLNGMTGMNKGQVVTSVDGIEFDMLKEDGVFIYNTRSCGIINKTA
jgi:hypothetical protein